MGDRLRYGDAIALRAAILDDSSTLTGAKHMDLLFPVTWGDLVDDLIRHGVGAPTPIKYKQTGGEEEPSDEELKQAQSLLSPIPGSGINN
ncbi:hypothetical protein OZX73_05340 [Bifidobacterium sp. ESL0775]|uniref:hypothetical protein n=1 Tax=Bifidobacterium sp. ESL0775 TaxID=2983230 RepID=UPI0023F8773F|nr:hypothetical protein [Bifidobacterium sp. ESL0775]WEV68716.1 hypothetical protein OZX73_05340 [Bifidobacterium sp. ESL0775]